MLEFIQEVGDFKSFVKGYLCSGATRLIGLGEMHLFRFYVESDGNPVMKYKKSAIDLRHLLDVCGTKTKMAGLDYQEDAQSLFLSS